MFRLNLKIALRNLWKNKVASLINILGLSIGLAACLLLLVYVSYEWNFDRQSKNLFTVMTNVTDDSGNIVETFNGSTTALSPVLKEALPEVKYSGRMNYGSMTLVANGTKSFKKNARFAEPDILKMYHYHFIEGDVNTALNDQKSVILTATMAKFLFGSTDVLNQSVRYNDQTDLKVTGVIEDMPTNMSNQFDYLMPWSFYESISAEAKDQNWNNFSFITLVEMVSDANLDRVNKKIEALIKVNNKGKYFQQFLFPLERLHLYGQFEYGKSVGGNINRIWLFMGLAFGILLIACINFMNMATARSEKRGKEVGIKKTIGATRLSLIAQFLTESMVLTIVSIVIAIVLLEIFLPAFNNLLHMTITMDYLNTYSWLGIVGIVLVTGLISGSYPAFYLSSFNPIQTLKGVVKSKYNFPFSLRQFLIVGQFCFTILLIISTLVIYKQIQFIKNKPVGVDANVLVEMPQEGTLSSRYDGLKSQLLKSGAVTDMFYSMSGLIHHGNNVNGLKWPGMKEDNRIQFNKMLASPGFIKTSGIKLTEGRGFSEYHASDTASVLVSRSAVKTMGLQHPVGQVLNLFGDQLTIIGVFEDYTWDSPYQSNHPMIVNYSKHNTGTVTMRLNAANSLSKNVAVIEKITKELNPAYPVEISFVNSIYSDLLTQERTLGILSNLFGGLAIFISCLGLLGLVAYSAEQRTKEFGIRKVLGASVASLMQLLSLSFIKLIVVAIVIAVPLASYLMNKWLQKFEFHTVISWWIILAATFGTLLIAFLTVSFQAYKTATSNPVDSLKYE